MEDYVLNDYRLLARRSLNRIGIAFGVAFWASNLLSTLIVLLFRDMPMDTITLVCTLLSDSAAFLCIVLILKPLTKAHLVCERLSFGRFLLAVPIGYGLMLFGNLASQLLLLIIGSAAENPLVNIVTLEQFTPIMLLAIVVIAPIFEELLFRKLLVPRLLVFGQWPAIIISGLLFGFFHGNLFQFVYAFLLGAFLAYLYIRTGKVILCMLLHGIINFIGSAVPMLLAYIEKSVSSYTSTLIVGLFDLLLLSMGVFGIVYIIIRLRKIGLTPAIQPKLWLSFFINPGMLVFIISTLVVLIVSLFMS